MYSSIVGEHRTRVHGHFFVSSYPGQVLRKSVKRVIIDPLKSMKKLPISILIIILLFTPVITYGAFLATVSTGPAVVTPSTTTLFATVDPHRSSTYAWFEYGKESSLKTQTEHYFVSMYAKPTSFSIKLNDLEKGVTYFYRVGAYNAYGSMYGNIRTFVAGVSGNNSDTQTQTITTPLPINVTANASVTKQAVTSASLISAIKPATKQQNTPPQNICVKLPDIHLQFIPTETIVEADGTYIYTILIANNTPKDINDLTIIIQLPAQTVFVEFIEKDNESAFTHRSGILLKEKLMLSAKEKKEFSFRLKIDNAVKPKDTFILSGIARFQNENQQNTTSAYAIITIAEQKTLSEQATLINDFSDQHPSVLVVGIIIVLLALVAIFTGSILYLHIKYKKGLPETYR